MKKKCVIIGYGGMGAYHAEAIAALDDLEVAGVYDIDPAARARARERGLTAFSSYEEAGEAAADFALLAVPNQLHRFYTEYFAARGKHILCEKPAACSLADWQAMVSAARRAGVVLTVNQNRRFDRDFAIVQQLLNDSPIGRIYRIESRVCGANGIPGGWRKLPECGGGMLLDWGVHLIDQFCTLIPASVVRLCCRLDRIFGFAVDDAVHLELEFADGTQGLVAVETNTYLPTPRWRLYGRDGTATVEDWDCRGKIVVPDYACTEELVAIRAGNGLTKTMAYRPHASVRELPLPDVRPAADAIYRGMCRACEGGRPVVSEAEAERVLRIMELAVRSSREHAVLDVRL